MARPNRSFGCGRRRPGILGLADGVELLLQAQVIKLSERQADEDVDAVGEHPQRIGEGKADFGLGPGRRRRIGTPQCAVIG